MKKYLLMSSAAVVIDALRVNIEVSTVKIVKFANRVDLDEAALYELPHLGLHCLPRSL